MIEKDVKTVIHDYNIPHFESVPDEWKVRSLGELMSIVYRYPSYYGITYVKDGVPEIRGELLLDSGEILSSRESLRHISEETSSRFPKTVLDEGDIVLTVRGTMGKVGIVRQTLSGSNITANLMRLSPRRDFVDSEYLKFVLMSKLFIDTLNRLSPQTTIKTIQSSVLQSIPIPVPDLREQHAIANVLMTIQRAREATEKVIAATRALKKSLMRYLFTYGPVPIDKAERVLLKETEIGTIPEHWDTNELREIVQSTRYGISQRGGKSGKYPILRMNNLVDGHVDVSDLQFVDLNDDMFKRFRVSRSDILFNRTNSFELVGKTSIFMLDGDFVFASYLIRLVADTEAILSRFLSYYLNKEDTQRRLKMLATRGVSQSNISATKLKSVVVPRPPLDEQERVANTLVTLDTKIEKEDKRKRALEEIFKTVLHLLMTGQIRVKDMEV